MNPGDIIIREATLDDTPSIARIHVESWRQTYRGIVPNAVLDSLDVEGRARMWQRAISDTTLNAFVYVAEQGGELFGFVSGGPERNGDPDFSGEVYAIYLTPTQQGRGIGRCLMDTAVHALREQGHESMLIWALTANPFTSFYRRLGGEPVRTQRVPMGQKMLEETGFGWTDLSNWRQGQSSGRVKRRKDLARDDQ